MSAASLALASGLLLAPAPAGEDTGEAGTESSEKARAGDPRAAPGYEPPGEPTEPSEKAQPSDPRAAPGYEPPGRPTESSEKAKAGGPRAAPGYEPPGEPTGAAPTIKAAGDAKEADKDEPAEADTEDEFGSGFDFEAYADGDGSEGGEASDSRSHEFKARNLEEKAVAAMGGVRLTGAYLHYPDEPLIYPTGDDALLAAVIRFLMEAKLGSHLELHTNLYLDLSRTPQLGRSGAFATAGSTASAYRTTYLAWDFWEDGSVMGQGGVDSVHLDLEAGPVTASLGRFPVNYAVTSVFTPNDFFAPFSATAINKIYKPGVDAMRVGVSLGTFSAIEAVGAMGYDDDDIPAWGRSATLVRASTVLWNFEWAAIGGKVAERWIAGGSIQGALGRVGLRSEGHAGFPDENGDGALDDDDEVHGRLAAGLDVTFAWHNATIGAEYGFFSDGTGDPDEYLERTLEFYPDDLPYMAQHYVGLLGGLDLIPILRLGVVGLVNAQDGSGLAGPSLTYNIADEADFIAGVFAPWGKQPSVDMSTLIPTFDIGSEFGPAPLTAFLETRFFF